MKLLPLETIARWVDGTLTQGGNIGIQSVVVRSRELETGGLLFNVARETPADFLRHCPRGGCAVVTDMDFAAAAGEPSAAVVRVKDVGAAYWAFVTAYRGLFEIPVIGVTGTCGKTTTKEMLRHILEGKYRVTSTYRSYNARRRHLGYLMEIDERTQAAVYEMGVAAPGDMQAACRYFRPQVGVITNIGVDHLAAFGSLDAYIRAKAEMVRGLEGRSTLILNMDDENTRTISLAGYQGRVMYFGTDGKADFQIRSFRQESGKVSFVLRHAGADYPVTVPGHGGFTAFNAAAAIAAAYAVGFDMRGACERMADFRPVESHFEEKRGAAGSTVIDDTWSTNPTSTMAALGLLRELSAGRTTVAALGRMSLLGRQSEPYHIECGRKAAELGIDYLVVIGEDARAIGEGALQGGMSPERVIYCRGEEDTADALLKLLDSHTVALVKTSMIQSFSGLIDRITVSD